MRCLRACRPLCLPRTNSVRAQAHVLRLHDFVGAAFLEHAVLMDAGFVGEGVLADDGLVALHVDAGDARDQPAGRAQAFGVDRGADQKVIRACMHGHHDFLEGAIAGPFAQAVDGAFDLASAFLEGGQAVGDRQARDRCGNGRSARSCRCRGRFA